MGEQQHSLTSPARGGRQLDPSNPSWPAVVATTVRLWFERHSHRSGRPTSRRTRGVLALSAVAAMALGALVTLAVTHQGQNSPSVRPSNTARSTTPNALQIAAANRSQAAAWIAHQVLPGTVTMCDTLMCTALEAAGVPAANLVEVQNTTQDPLQAEVVVATPAVRSQFGSRLASVYAPLVMASFGSGSERIDVRYVAPDGTAAFEASLAPDLSTRVTAGKQLLSNKNVQASQQARAALLAGDVDWRLLVTLSALAHEMPVHLVTFDDSSPGAGPAVPLRGAELGAARSGSLSAMLAFLAAQRASFLPAVHQLAKNTSGQSVVTVQFDAPGWLGQNGP